MKESQIVAIKQITADLGDLIIQIGPNNPGEWWAYERMVSAHKSLRGIDYAKIAQTPLEIDGAKTQLGECPECHGSGQVSELAEGGNSVMTACPVCKGTGKAQIPLGMK